MNRAKKQAKQMIVVAVILLTRLVASHAQGTPDTSCDNAPVRCIEREKRIVRPDELRDVRGEVEDKLRRNVLSTIPERSMWIGDSGDKEKQECARIREILNAPWSAETVAALAKVLLVDWADADRWRANAPTTGRAMVVGSANIDQWRAISELLSHIHTLYAGQPLGEHICLTMDSLYERAMAMELIWRETKYESRWSALLRGVLASGNTEILTPCYWRLVESDDCCEVVTFTTPEVLQKVREIQGRLPAAMTAEQRRNATTKELEQEECRKRRREFFANSIYYIESCVMYPELRLLPRDQDIREARKRLEEHPELFELLTQKTTRDDLKQFYLAVTARLKKEKQQKPSQP